MIPASPQLHDSISMNERAEHHAGIHMNYAAAKGIGSEYARIGGTFVNSIEDLDPKAREYVRKKEAKTREEKKEKERKAKGFV